MWTLALVSGEGFTPIIELAVRDERSAVFVARQLGELAGTTIFPIKSKHSRKIYANAPIAVCPNATENARVAAFSIDLESLAVCKLAELDAQSAEWWERKWAGDKRVRNMQLVFLAV